MENTEMDLEGLKRYLQDLNPPEREVYKLIFRELGARRGNHRLDRLISKVRDELDYNGEMAITACQCLEKHGFVEAKIDGSDGREVEIREPVIVDAKVKVWIKNRKVEASVGVSSIYISPTQKLIPLLYFEP